MRHKRIIVFLGSSTASILITRADLIISILSFFKLNHHTKKKFDHDNILEVGSESNSDTRLTVGEVCMVVPLITTLAGE